MPVHTKNSVVRALRLIFDDKDGSVIFWKEGVEGCLIFFVRQNLILIELW